MFGKVPFEMIELKIQLAEKGERGKKEKLGQG